MSSSTANNETKAGSNGRRSLILIGGFILLLLAAALLLFGNTLFGTATNEETTADTAATNVDTGNIQLPTTGPPSRRATSPTTLP